MNHNKTKSIPLHEDKQNVEGNQNVIPQKPLRCVFAFLRVYHRFSKCHALRLFVTLWACAGEELGSIAIMWRLDTNNQEVLPSIFTNTAPPRLWADLGGL